MVVVGGKEGGGVSVGLRPSSLPPFCPSAPQAHARHAASLAQEKDPNAPKKPLSSYMFFTQDVS